ncbi:hypothetical protein CISIN_1g0178601mg, partial [Citrus sinensis]
IADVWSCGVTLYVMLVGGYPFEDPDEPKDFRKTIQRILSVQYSVPDTNPISQECRDLISRIFVADPAAVSIFFFPLNMSCLLLFSFVWMFDATENYHS